MARDRRKQPRESLDGFLFNVEKFFGSVPCQRMSFTEKGVYLVMLFQAWRSGGTLPDDPKAVAELIAVTAEQAAEVEAAWPVVRRKFAASERDPSWIVNIALEDTRRKQWRYLDGKAAAGRKGGEAKSRNFRTSNRLDRVAVLQQNVAVLQKNVAVPDFDKAKRSDQIRLEKSREEKKEQETSAESLTRSTPVLVFPTQGTPNSWTLTEAMLADWAPLYPGLDVLAEARKALAWVQASGPHRKTARGMPQFLVNWFNRTVQNGTRREAVPTMGRQTTRLAAALDRIDREEES